MINRYFPKAVLLLALLLTAGCATHSHVTTHTQTQGTFKVGNPYRVQGQWYYPREEYDLVESGIASWYGPGFDGGHTASGEIYHANELTAAHRTLQMPSLVRVTNLDNGRSVVVRVNDRGPYSRGRIMDVSSKAADLLGMKGTGTAKVQLQVLSAESMRVAQLAKTGASTRGYEVAMNNPPATPSVATPETQPKTVEDIVAQPLTAPVAAGTPAAVPAPVEVVATPSKVTPNYELAASEAVPAKDLPPPGPVPGHLTNGKFYPDPIVTQEAVKPSAIYVQAGSFTVRDNADRLVQKLAGFHAGVSEATINGKHFYRVRIGPVGNVPAADQMLGRIVHAGNKQAIITVE